jgi:ribosomal-protein-alanine N-acetyltransferase
VTRYLLWSPHTSKRITHDFLRYIRTRYGLGDFYDWAVVEKESGRMIGTCGFASIDTDNDAGEVGYVLNPEYWGKGYATEALSRMLSFGFGVLGMHRIYVRIMSGNIASERVAKKCGMRHEATHIDGMRIKGNYETIEEYAILAREFYGKRV